MKIGTIIFTYHRSIHTKKVLDALSRNDILPQKLYVFQDGIKENTNISEWRKVNSLIREISWCETEVCIAEKNKGLAKSVVTGINYAFQECDAVVVLEDDCVPDNKFMKFMVSALDTYQKKEKVYAVSGYAWDVNLTDRKEDAYFNGRVCSYGWGTWKDKWNQYEEDYNILNKIKNNSEAYARLQIWGQDLKEMLLGNILGRCNSWAVFWALKVIEKGGYCLSPHQQLIHNVGFDGSGENCGIKYEKCIVKESEYKDSFLFPQKVGCTQECEEEFQFLFARKYGEEKIKLYQELLIQWIQMKQMGKTVWIPKEWGDYIAVWGKGKIFDCFLSELKGQITVKYIIESSPSAKEYKGIPIIMIDELPDTIKNVVVIPYFDLLIISKRVKKIKPSVHLVGINELLNF